MDVERVMKALLICQDAVFVEAVPAVLSRAGFTVVACGTDPLLNKARFVTRFMLALDSDDLVRY